MFLEHSLLADFFWLGLRILIVASFASFSLDSISGDASLFLVSSFILTGMPSQLVLSQKNW